MEDHITYDPRTKQKIKELLFEHLYRPILDKLEKELQYIIKKNSVLLLTRHESFMYKGILYSCDNQAPPRRANKIHESMIKPMDEYLAKVKEINSNELPYVLGFINQTLNSSNNLNDYLRIFPEYLHSPIEKLIKECPCRNKSLSDKEILELQNKHKIPIELVKKRMVINLLT